MKTRIIILLAILTPVLMSGCKKHCYGVPDEIVEYFPYQESDVLSFIDEQDDTIVFEVKWIYKAEPKDIDWNCKCGGCEDYYLIDFNYSQTVPVDGHDVSGLLTFGLDFSHYRGGPMELDKNDKSVYGYIEGSRCVWSGTYSNDSLLFTYYSGNNHYFDSLLVARGAGLTSFCTTTGHHYTALDSH